MATYPTLGPDEDFPSRPDHLHFDILSALIITLDGEADDAGKDFDLEAVTARYVDPKSLGYLAMQRAIRALEITTSTEALAKTSEMIKLAAVYHEAFIVGCRFQQTKGKTSNGRSSKPRE